MHCPFDKILVDDLQVKQFVEDYLQIPQLLSHD